jgi:hypothetical protein
MFKISNTLLAVSQLTNEKSAKTAQKFMAYLDKVYRSVVVSNLSRMLQTTVSFTDLDQGGEMIIFESILTTFDAAGATTKICLKHHGILSLPKSVKHTVEH